MHDECVRACGKQAAAGEGGGRSAIQAAFEGTLGYRTRGLGCDGFSERRVSANSPPS